MLLHLLFLQELYPRFPCLISPDTSTSLLPDYYLNIMINIRMNIKTSSSKSNNHLFLIAAQERIHLIRTKEQKSTFQDRA